MLRCALAAVPMACAVLLSSCYGDEYGDCPATGGDAVPVKVNVSAGVIGDLNGSRAGGDVNAEEHEFMHTLYLCILDEQGYVQEMFHAEDGSLQNLIVSEPAAATGDIFNWTSDEFTLPVGTYTIYAFANVDGYIGENDQTEDVDVMRYLQNQFRIGAGVRTDLPRFRLNDPASKIDFANGMYIPMSAKKTITITPNTRDISIGLDRLVSKVRITVPDNQYVSTNSTITFSGYSENVPLLGADNGGYGDAQLYGGTTTTDEIPFTQVGEDVSFYVNETPGGNPFTVTLSTGNTTGGVSTYTATTERTELPRNSIYPLTLTFSDFGISITPRAWLEVLGIGYKVEYTPEKYGVYRVKLATGSYFELTPEAITAGGAPISGVTWKWTQDGNLPTGYVVKIDDNTDTVTGNLPAGGKSYYGEFTLKLNGKWTYNRADYDRTYTFIIDVCRDEVWAMGRLIDNGANSRAAEMPDPAYRLAPEYLNMFKVK